MGRIQFSLFYTSLLLNVILIFNCSCAYDHLVLWVKKRSTFLEKYQNYGSLAITQVEVPPLTEFVSFKISAEPFDLSIFGCDPVDVLVYVKKGSIPVLNPDNSEEPETIRTIGNSQVYALKLRTDKRFKYINITSPESGIFYVVAFFPYVARERMAVKQRGLSKDCTGFINILTYISTVNVALISHQKSYEMGWDYYEFSVNYHQKSMRLRVKQTKDTNSTDILVQIAFKRIPSDYAYLYNQTIKVSDDFEETKFWLDKPGLYYLKFENFLLGTVFEVTMLTMRSGGKLDQKLYKTAIMEYHLENNKTEELMTYKLLKQSSSESFLYTFNIDHELESEFIIPAALNLTSIYTSVLKMKLRDFVDTGGVLMFSVNLLSYVDRQLLVNSADHVIIGCISREDFEVPVLPGKCLLNGIYTPASVMINNTADNSSIFIPYPESGLWYVSFKLFCKPCQNCDCYQKRSDMLRKCLSECECSKSTTCSKCSNKCKSHFRDLDECHCNNCVDTGEVCNSTLTFHLTSFPCFLGSCGANGHCEFVLAEGFIFSTCVCHNGFRGIDCTDGSKATPLWRLIVSEVLLISSNLVMLPCSYLAWKRRHRNEAAMYLSVFLFSSLYHACDVEDNLFRFCLTSYNSLQFADFFTALLSIWATLLVVSNITFSLRVLLEVIGAILLSYFTAVDKTGIWIFLTISVPGFAIIFVSWYTKYREAGCSFIDNKYLKYNIPSGLLVIGVGVVIYAFLQTAGNYMYMHSAWHCTVGITVIIVLPSENTFKDLGNIE